MEKAAAAIIVLISIKYVMLRLLSRITKEEREMLDRFHDLQ